MDESSAKTIEAIRSTQLEANGWRTDIRVDIARVEEAVKEIAKDERDAHENITVIRKDLAKLTNTVTQISTSNAEKIQQLETWRSGLWPRALGLLAIVQVVAGAFLTFYLKGH